MADILKVADVKRIVKLIGYKGAVFALKESRKIRRQELIPIARDLHIGEVHKLSKWRLAEAIISQIGEIYHLY
ncbi:MAG: hypothetical protein ACFFFC_00155 [Candidatus Thorarchaeota archaeon]